MKQQNILFDFFIYVADSQNYQKVRALGMGMGLGNQYPKPIEYQYPYPHPNTHKIGYFY